MVIAVEQRERAMSAGAQPQRGSIFNRQTGRTQSDTDGVTNTCSPQLLALDQPILTDCLCFQAAAASAELDPLQAEAYEELIVGIEQREGRARKRVYTYVYESDEEGEGGGGAAAGGGATLAMFRLNCAGRQVDLVSSQAARRCF